MEIAWLDDLLKEKNPDIVLPVPVPSPKEPPKKKMSDIEVLNSLFETDNKGKGFNRVPNTASTPNVFFLLKYVIFSFPSF